MVEKKRVLLDTNVYSYLLDEVEQGLLEAVRATERASFYGCEVVRNELKKIPAAKKHAGRNYRSLALKLYDELVRGHAFEVTSVIETIASEYARAFRGNRAARKLRKDFLIVACASFHGLDVLVSDDHQTMFSAASRRAYGSVNEKNYLRTPSFYGLRDLKKLV